jgi:hypothetical protein
LQKEWGRDGCSFDLNSSALELLSNGLGKDMLEQHSIGTAENRTKKLKKKADTATVKLMPTADGPKLPS